MELKSNSKVNVGLDSHKFTRFTRFYSLFLEVIGVLTCHGFLFDLHFFTFGFFPLTEWNSQLLFLLRQL